MVNTNLFIKKTANFPLMENNTKFNVSSMCISSYSNQNISFKHCYLGLSYVIRFHLRSNIACYKIKIHRICQYIDIHMHFISMGMLRMTGPISFSTTMSVSFWHTVLKLWLCSSFWPPKTWQSCPTTFLASFSPLLLPLLRHVNKAEGAKIWHCR